nr:Type I phosphodiesterase nucleotide pyrophosphatase phosphate transferase domain containing protein [Haemonchus contortus]
MRNASFDQIPDEQTPMVTEGTTTKNNGAIPSMEPAKAGYQKSALPSDRRFSHLLVLLMMVFVMSLLCVILGVVMAVKLVQMDQQIDEAQIQLPRTIKKTLNDLQIPIRSDHLIKPPELTWPPLPGDTLTQAEIIRKIDPASIDGTGREKTLFSRKECPKQCSREDFSSPPLVVLSMDGFAREYLDRYSLDSLSYVAKCGATAERVFPPFPSRTFPSHYTMVTGLYPESHGIVDNNIYDPLISDQMESMKKVDREGFYKGDPIWNIYKRHGGKTACLFWPGCAFNVSGSRPDISLPYNKDLPFRNRFDMILNWLLQPKESRSGLITAYLDQPDSAGHYQVDEQDIKAQLTQLDDNLRYLIGRLDSAGILPCINLVIVSDHGMQKMNNTQYFSELLPDSGVIAASGVIGRIHKYKSSATVDQLMKPFTCEKGDRWKVYSRDSMPTRKHYQKTPRVGDVIVQGEPGTSFYPDPSKDFHLSGDHGYDFINPSMQTVFFAMGPSIKKGVVVPAFQNIEYLNLFLDLLGLPQNVPNNGTVGLLDGVLAHPPPRLPEFYFPILECLNVGPPIASSCHACSTEELAWISFKLACPFPKQELLQISSKSAYCVQNYCEKMLIVGGGKYAPVAVYETLKRGATRSPSSCHFVNSKYGSICSKHMYSSGLTSKSLSADEHSGFANISTIEIPWKSKFVTDVLDPLNEYTQSLAERMTQVISITGTAFDFDYNGIADDRPSYAPSHLYRILITCAGPWSHDGTSCMQPSDLMTLSFIFPHIDGDINCLTKEDLLLEYTARLLDVELISGLRFSFPNIPHEQTLRLKTHINTKLW